jgi:predicted RNA methylase
MIENYSEDSYIFHDILPAFAQYGYPQAGDHENLKIKSDAKILIGSGRYLYPDVVFYANKHPLLIVEAKKPDRSEDKALTEVLSYLRHLQFSQSPPKFFALTFGRSIKFYRYFKDIQNDQIVEKWEELPTVLSYEELKNAYGIKTTKPKITPDEFKKLFYEIASIFIFDKEKNLTPEIIKKVIIQIYEFLKDQENFVSQQPYVSLDRYLDRKQALRNLLCKYDWSSLGPEIALVFHQQILRSFQGAQLNQYITPSEIVSFMINLVDPKETDKLLDFECGSGSFIRAAISAEAKIENILGIDIADLPYYTAKTFLALYFGIIGENIESIPILQDNGLYNHRNDWDVVVSNPAGGNKYDPEGELNDINKVLEYLEDDLDLNKRPDTKSEYNFSIQQAVRSAKVGGKICLILPEGLFANSSDHFLRAYISKYCKILAIISLPRGVFYKGTTTKTVTSGSTKSTQKMSILYAVKTSEVQPKSGVLTDFEDLNYPVFLASIESAENLENDLFFVLEQYKRWEGNHELNVDINLPQKIVKRLVKPIQQKLIPPAAPLFESVEKATKEKPKIQSVSIIDGFLQGLFKKK